MISALKKSAEEATVFYTYSSAMMDEATQALLQANEATLISSLDTENILPDLISHGVVSVRESDNIITSYQRPDDRAKKLVNILYTRGQANFNTFVAVLGENGYEGLARRLTSSDVHRVDNEQYGGWVSE